MTDFQQSPGRAAEKVIGFVAMLIALGFLFGLVLLVFRMSLEFSKVAVAVTLVACVYWFAQLGYRLVFNKQQTGGGLLGARELRFWCQFFGVVSVIECAVGIYNGNVGLVMAGGFMLIACLFGMRIADSRSARKERETSR